MINDHRTRRCFYSATPCVVLHELFYGTSGRKICMKYNIQVPVGELVHGWCHGKPCVDGYKDNWQKEGCDWLGIDCDKTRLAINNINHEDWAIKYLESIKDHCLQKLIESEN